MIFLKNDMSTKNELLERFIRYAQTYSQSDSSKADEGIVPSTPQQKEFALSLSEELKSLGFLDVTVSDHSYIHAYIPSTKGFEKVEPFCLLAHMDTVEEVSGLNVKPNVIENYDGHKIELNNSITLDPAKIKELKIAGEEKDTIITTDGTTLLGADDKAGLAAIVTSLHYLLTHPEIGHGKIEVVFSPDEETGHGMDFVPTEKILSKYAYTVDGGHLGELEYECFNAYKSDITFTGVASHTNKAREKGMVNAISMASAFVQNLPRHEAPETTDARLGFYAPYDINGNMETSRVTLLLRDFDIDAMEKRKALVDQIASSIAAAFGGKAEVVHTQQYLNMYQKIQEHPYVVEYLKQAYKNADVVAVSSPIRGGTDGSRLTEMGIPTPNIFTGAHNYHSQYEWVSLTQMLSASEVIIQLAILATKGGNKDA